MKFELIFDILIICLLFPTIIYAVILNHRLKSLRSNQEDFGKLIWAFNDATNRAEAGTTKLKQLAEHTGTTLKEQVDKARVLRDDLSYFIEQANINADKLEATIRKSRDDIKNAQKLLEVAMPPAEEKAPAKKAAVRPQIAKSKKNTYADEDDFLDLDADRSEAERDLIRALQAIR